MTIINVHTSNIRAPCNKKNDWLKGRDGCQYNNGGDLNDPFTSIDISMRLRLTIEAADLTQTI